MSKELIPCPIDGTNLDWDIINDCFDNNECLSHDNTYVGFVEGRPVEINLFGYTRRHVIRVIAPCSFRQTVLRRIREVLAENDENNPDSEYHHIAKMKDYDEEIYFYYESKN